MDKDDVEICVCARVYTTEYYSAMVKKDILPFITTWMNPEDIRLSEMRQTNCTISLIRTI